MGQADVGELAGGDVPEPGLAVAATGSELRAVGAEGDLGDEAAMREGSGQPGQVTTPGGEVRAGGVPQGRVVDRRGCAEAFDHQEQAAIDLAPLAGDLAAFEVEDGQAMIGFVE